MDEKLQNLFLSLNSPDLDSKIKEILLELHNNESNYIHLIPKINDRISSFLKANQNSKETIQVIKLALSIYQKIGFKIEFNLEDLFDFQSDEDPKGLSKNKIIEFENDEEQRLENPFLCFDLFHVLLSMLTAILNKNLKDYQPQLTLILPLLSMYSHDKKAQTIIRRQKFIKNLLKIFKKVIESAEKLQQIDIDLSNYVFQIIAKITYQNVKNQEYFLKKKGHEMIKSILLTAKDINLFKAAVVTLANCCEKPEARLLLWSSGMLNVYFQRLAQASSLEKKTIEETQTILIGIWKLAVKTDEVIEECLYSNEIERFSRAIVERKTTPQLLQSLCNVDALAVALVRQFANSKKHRKLAKSKYLVQVNPNIYLDIELNGCLGAFSVESDSEELLHTPLIVSSLLDIILCFFSKEKVLKTGLGCLTNFTAFEKPRNLICLQTNFYVLLYNIFEKYDHAASIVDCALKLSLNSIKHELCFKNLSHSKFLIRLLYLHFLYKGDDEISSLIVTLLYTVTREEQTKEAFFECIKEFENSNKDFDYCGILIQNMKTNFEQIEKLKKVILFFADLANSSSDFQKKVQENQTFANLIKDILDFNKNSPESFEIITACLAYLPIEELNILF